MVCELPPRHEEEGESVVMEPVVTMHVSRDLRHTWSVLTCVVSASLVVTLSVTHVRFILHRLILISAKASFDL